MNIQQRLRSIMVEPPQYKFKNLENQYDTKDDDSDYKIYSNEVEKRNVYLYIGSVVLILGLLFLCMYCCVKRKNRVNRPKPTKQALVQQNTQRVQIELDENKGKKQNDVQLAQLP